MQQAETFASLLLEGNAGKVWEEIRKYPHLTRIEVYQNLITPAMQHIGHLWETNQITVADEHLATATCDFVLSKLAYQHEKRSSPQKAMFLCLDGEQHYIGLKMVNSLFEEHGWETKYFGPSLPLEYALKTAKEWKPSVIGMSVSIVYHLPKLKEYAEAFAKLPHKPAVILGGRLAGKYDLLPYSSDRTVILKDLPETKNWLQNYEAGGRQNAIF
ncbi:MULTISPECIES: cobalamin B12-binding domain-containing protein [Cytobacillus]|uniref:cobalamin B12-binding domain-containing protein n=1 Tax=Cytobacillus TaxID=2675230 RepID=UPI00203A6EA3|nr:cobalamin-dependent protein [Cytobacillus firmus]MCM3708063.1 cobalamin-dependent protein [Cytobacillus firmus]